MSSLGDVLELIHSSTRRFRAARALGRTGDSVAILEVLGDERVAGRSAVILRATPRPGAEHWRWWGFWDATEPMEIPIDRERGVALGGLGFQVDNGIIVRARRNPQKNAEVTHSSNGFSDEGIPPVPLANPLAKTYAATYRNSTRRRIVSPRTPKGCPMRLHISPQPWVSVG